MLPALPTGRIEVGGFTPEISDTGARHTITQPLEGRSWGDWVRYIEASADVGDVLMTARDGDPLLIVDRVGEGRVAQIMSGQIWLWARGYDGGGPYAELMRRMIHWLMKEPELEERQLRLEPQGGTLRTVLTDADGITSSSTQRVTIAGDLTSLTFESDPVGSLPPDCSPLGGYLPAEVSDQRAFDGERSLHLLQAEYRLHAQKAILEWMWDLLPEAT